MNNLDCRSLKIQIGKLNENFDNALKLLEEEMAREYAGGHPYLDPGSMAYSEGNDEPVLVNDSIDYEQPDEEDEETVRNNENFNRQKTLRRKKTCRKSRV